MRAPDVLCIDADPRRRALIARAVEAAGGAPVAIATVEAAFRRRGSAVVAVGVGELGLAVLQRLAAAHHRALRIAVAPLDDAEAVVGLVSRIRPFQLVGDPVDPARLEAAIAAALTEAPAGGETTERVPVPGERSTFERLTVDGPSGVWSATYLRLRLHEESLRARRYARPLSLGLLDIDGLRELEDEHGPRATALLVQQVGSVLLRGARAVDMVGRWAAGAFAVVLPETAGVPAWGICERLRAQVAATPIASPLGPLAARLSAGVAGQPRRARDVSDLVTLADAALWSAKRSGGDRTVGDEPR